MIKIRTCIACRTKGNKQDFIRIVEKDGMAVVDDTKKANKRAMYICNKAECINKLLKSKDITKCIKIKANSDSVRELLKNLGE